MKNTYLAIIAIVALATAAALTPLAVQQQVFAQVTDGPSTPSSDGGLQSSMQSSSETDNGPIQKCNISGIGNDCHQAGSAELNVE
jgi:hypothetical protein